MIMFLDKGTLTCILNQSENGGFSIPSSFLDDWTASSLRSTNADLPICSIQALPGTKNYQAISSDYAFQLRNYSFFEQPLILYPFIIDSFVVIYSGIKFSLMFQLPTKERTLSWIPWNRTGSPNCGVAICMTRAKFLCMWLLVSKYSSQSVVNSIPSMEQINAMDHHAITRVRTNLMMKNETRWRGTKAMD